MRTSSRVRTHRRLIVLIAVSGLIVALSPIIRSQANGRPGRRQKSPAIGSDQIASEHSTWRDYAGAPDGAQYSALDQINRSNVSQLRVAWSYPTGDGSKYLYNPIVVGRTIYVLARNNSVVALDSIHATIQGRRPGVAIVTPTYRSGREAQPPVTVTVVP